MPLKTVSIASTLLPLQLATVPDHNPFLAIHAVVVSQALDRNFHLIGYNDEGTGRYQEKALFFLHLRLRASAFTSGNERSD